MPSPASSRRRRRVSDELRRSARSGAPRRRTFASSGSGSPASAPDDDFWYHPVGVRSAAGVSVTPASALTIAAFYRAVRILSDDVAQLPLHLYERLPERDEGRPGGRRRVTGALDELLAASGPWRQMSTAHMLMRGNAYSRIVSGPRGYVDQLRPLAPHRVKPEYLDSGRVLFRHINKAGREERLTEEEVFHLPWFRLDPDDPAGVSVVGLARASLGLTIATEQFGARQFSQTPRPSFAITSLNKIDKPRRQELGESFREAFSGQAGHGGVPVMDDGMTLATIGMSHDDAQFLETRVHQVRDIARWFGLPPHMLGDLADATFSNIEHSGIEYVTRPLMPLLVQWEQAIKSQLILDSSYSRFNVGALLRGDSLSRAQAQQIRANSRALTPNEIREQEEMNPVPWGDEPLETQGAAPAQPGRGPGTPAPQNASANGLDPLPAAIQERLNGSNHV